MQYLFIIYKHCLYSVFVVYSVLNNYLESFYYRQYHTIDLSFLSKSSLFLAYLSKTTKQAGVMPWILEAAAMFLGLATCSFSANSAFRDTMPKQSRFSLNSKFSSFLTASMSSFCWGITLSYMAMARTLSLQMKSRDLFPVD